MKINHTTKFIASFLAVALLSGTLAPTAALARPYHRGGHHGYHHHHHHHHHGGSGWGIALGAIGIAGMIAAANQPRTKVFADYPTARAYYIGHFDKGESALWSSIRGLEPGDYEIKYDRGSTERRIRKFARLLNQDIMYTATDEDNQIVYFKKLSAAE